MALEEHVAGDAGIHRDPVELAGVGQFRFVEGVAVAQPQDAVGEVAGISIGGDIDELGGEIGIG